MWIPKKKCEKTTNNSVAQQRGAPKGNHNAL
jgi:hypothetical protein